MPAPSTTTTVPLPSTTTTVSAIMERGKKRVVLNIELTIELLAIIVVASFIGIIVFVVVVYKCLRTKSASGYSDPDDTGDDLPDLSDREDVEAGETDDLKPY